MKFHFHPSTTATALYLLLSCTLPTSHAWGSLGHETIAYIASNFVCPATQSLFQTILHNQTTSYLAGVATWADSFRYTAAGRFSAPFHFIDAEDDPPASCGVVYARDCPVEGCVVGAIRNYTAQLLDPDLGAGSRNMAAKFVVHRWATALTTAIKTGVYKTDAESWLRGIDLSDPVGTSIRWAEEANQFVCQTVLPEGKDAVVGKELGGAYYEAAVPVH
ncbi:Nuclease S1 [Lachnellula willkommii]|uniref:Nuclease S1 n=1 Tax=Lachnellula willkommii TaxID=215461 RepID=A0A559MH75_9HELO|nr:Nuclease S1 [Lachnellula willkommii]